MSTGEDPGMGGVASGPTTEEELEEVAAADIDELAEELEPFDRLVQRSRRLTEERVQAIVESLLLVSDRPVTVDQLHEATGIEPARLGSALTGLAARLLERAGGMVLVEVAGGWQLRTEPESMEYVRRLLRLRPQRLTRAAVETLSIVAYRQPVTRPEIEEIRGVDSAAVVKALLDRRLIKILGRKDEIGRPILYGTTREFLEFFALKDLSALPTLREFQELSEEHQALVEHEAPRATLRDLTDPGFGKRLDESTPSAEAALAELENAIAQADRKTRAAASALDAAAGPPAPVPPDPEGR